MPKLKTAKLAVAHIRIDGGTQTREEISENAVSDYAEALKAGIQLPPAVVFNDGSNNWLADGFHRFHAAAKIKAQLLCEIHPGTRRDAVLHAAGANAAHGLRRSNETKRRAVLLLLNDEEWCQWSAPVIAEKCGVSDEFVRKIRASQPPTVGGSNEKRIGADGKMRPVSISPKPAEIAAPEIYTEEEKYILNNGMTDAEIEAANAPTGTDAEEESKVSNSRPLNPLNSTGIEPPAEVEAPPLSIEDQIEALPLAQALALYQHNGHIFRQQATIYLENEKSLSKFRRAVQGDIRHAKGPISEAFKAAIGIGHPSTWEGCPSCKGSLRVGERADPCSLCNGVGFTTRKDEGVSADVVTIHAESL